MRILAWDQSSKLSGWCCMDNGEYIDSGVIDKSKINPIDNRIKAMGLDICDKIQNMEPDMVVIEGVQKQSGVSTVIALARLQGIIIGWCHANWIKCEILMPSSWRSTLSYKQGAGVKRKELKQQSFDYVKEHLGFDDFSEDRCEACCIAIAASEMFGK